MRIHPLPLAAIILPVVLPLAAACGGHSPTPPPTSGADTLTDIAYLTGTVNRDAYNVSTFYPNTDILVGDEDAYQPNYRVRGIVTFNMKAIPQNANIAGATLQMAQCFVSGSPFASLGNVVVDDVPVMTTPDSAFYDTAAVAPAVGTLATDSTLGLKTASIPSLAADRAAGDTLIQLRLRFSTEDSNNNGTSDFVAFSPDSGLATICTPYVTGHRPLLIVSFQ
jgi:hypothetical protein